MVNELESQTIINEFDYNGHPILSIWAWSNLSLMNKYIYIHIYPTPPLGQDMTQGLSGV